MDSGVRGCGYDRWHEKYDKIMRVKAPPHEVLFFCVILDIFLKEISVFL